MMGGLDCNGQYSVGCASALPAPGNAIAELYHHVRLIELFAGAAELTRVVQDAGLPVVPPEYCETLGGTY